MTVKLASIDCNSIHFLYKFMFNFIIDLMILASQMNQLIDKRINGLITSDALHYLNFDYLHITESN